MGRGDAMAAIVNNSVNKLWTECSRLLVHFGLTHVTF